MLQESAAWPFQWIRNSHALRGTQKPISQGAKVMYTAKMPVHPLSRRERDGPLRVICGGRLANDKVPDMGWFQTGIGSGTMIN